MPVKHRKVSTAPDIGEPNTIMVSDWNDNMIGQGGGDQLPLMRKFAHADGMEFALTAQEVRDAIDVYSREEVDNLIELGGGGGGGGVPTGGLTNQILTKKSNTDNDTEWRHTILDAIFQGRDYTGIIRSALWVEPASNLIRISDGGLNALLQGDLTVTHPGSGHRILEMQTDGPYVPYFRFHRRNKSVWSFGSDDSGLVFSSSWGLDAPKFRIDANGNTFMPQGAYLYGGGRGMIAFDGSNTVLGGPLYATSNMYINGSARSAGFSLAQNTAMQSESGRWIAYDRTSDGEMIYAYNTNDCFNEQGGRTLFHRYVQFDGQANFNSTVNHYGPTYFYGGTNLGTGLHAWGHYSSINGWQSSHNVGGLNVQWTGGFRAQVDVWLNSTPPSGFPVVACNGTVTVTGGNSFTINLPADDQGNFTLTFHVAG